MAIVNVVSASQDIVTTVRDDDVVTVLSDVIMPDLSPYALKGDIPNIEELHAVSDAAASSATTASQAAKSAVSAADSATAAQTQAASSATEAISAVSKMPTILTAANESAAMTLSAENPDAWIFYPEGA